MEATTIAVLISAFITGIIGPLLTIIIQKRLKDCELPTPSKARLDRLKGKWYGYFKQVIADEEVTFDVKISLKNQGKTIQGESTYENEKGEKISLTLYNGIFDGNILKIEYKNELPYIFQIGSVVLQMNGRGDTCHGNFVGYTPKQNIATGEIYCTNKSKAIGENNF